ncbi:MAG: dockerin type I domain-containing protein [Bryobacteraceae bacterium]
MSTTSRGLSRYGLLLVTLFCVAVRAQTLQIATPSDGSTYVPGDTIIVIVTTSGPTFNAVTAIIQDVGISRPITSAPYVFSFKVPAVIAGKKTITALGSTGPGAGVFSSPITINVENGASITSLTVNPSSIKFQYAGQQIPLVVNGTFSDGSVSDITRSSRVSYLSANPTVTIASADGVLTAGAPGQTMVTVTYGGMSKAVTAIVPTVIRGDLDADGDVDQDDLNLILAVLNTPASKPRDARDLNGDGVINVLDARSLATLCTRARCATR